MNKLILLLISVSLYSCVPSSFCFLDKKECKIYISNRKEEKITELTVVYPDSTFFYGEFNPPIKEFFLKKDSVVNKAIWLMVCTTSPLDHYKLHLKESDWLKSKHKKLPNFGR